MSSCCPLLFLSDDPVHYKEQTKRICDSCISETKSVEQSTLVSPPVTSRDRRLFCWCSTVHPNSYRQLLSYAQTNLPEAISTSKHELCLALGIPESLIRTNIEDIQESKNPLLEHPNDAFCPPEYFDFVSREDAKEFAETPIELDKYFEHVFFTPVTDFVYPVDVSPKIYYNWPIIAQLNAPKIPLTNEFFVDLQNVDKEDLNEVMQKALDEKFLEDNKERTRFLNYIAKWYGVTEQEWGTKNPKPKVKDLLWTKAAERIRQETMRSDELYARRLMQRNPLSVVSSHTPTVPRSVRKEKTIKNIERQKLMTTREKYLEKQRIALAQRDRLKMQRKKKESKQLEEEQITKRLEERLRATYGEELNVPKSEQHPRLHPKTILQTTPKLNKPKRVHDGNPRLSTQRLRLPSSQPRRRYTLKEPLVTLKSYIFTSDNNEIWQFTTVNFQDALREFAKIHPQMDEIQFYLDLPEQEPPFRRLDLSEKLEAAENYITFLTPLNKVPYHIEYPAYKDNLVLYAPITTPLRELYLIAESYWSNKYSKFISGITNPTSNTFTLGQLYTMFGFPNVLKFKVTPKMFVRGR